MSMYYDLIKFPIHHKNLKWESKEVLLDVYERPHLFQMIWLTGTEFPVRAQMPQVWVGDVFAKHVLVDRSRRIVSAYFDKPPQNGGAIYFGHFSNAELYFGKFNPRKLVRLDRLLLPENVVLYKTYY